MPADRVFAIVLNYRHDDDTARCVGALRRSSHRNTSLVVVDNAPSADGLAARFEATTVLSSGGNVGYAAGNNVGIRHALDHGADFVWILNPDTVAGPAALERLVATAQSYADAGVIGARILHGGSDPARIWFNGGIIDWDRGAMTRHRDDGRRDRDVPATRPQEVDYVTGAAMLVRRAVFRDIGFLPEHYFLYFEETDFNLRARHAGWRCLVEPRARLWHHKRSSGRLPQPTYVYYFVRNRLLFGAAYADHSFDQLVADVDEWVGAWRGRVQARAPGWLATFDRLVSWAVEDARAGRSGARPEVHALGLREPGPAEPDEPAGAGPR